MHDSAMRAPQELAGVASNDGLSQKPLTIRPLHCTEVQWIGTEWCHWPASCPKGPCIAYVTTIPTVAVPVALERVVDTVRRHRPIGKEVHVEAGWAGAADP